MDKKKDLDVERKEVDLRLNEYQKLVKLEKEKYDKKKKDTKNMIFENMEIEK